MRTVAAVAALLALAGSAIAGTLKIPVHKQGPGSAVSKHPLLTKRASAIEELVNNITGGGYYASVSVGTPGQSINLVLDTGSSDAFVVDVNADLCTSRRLQVEYGMTCDATFDSSDSSTFSVVQQNGFSIEYLDGSTASGDFVSDSFEIADVTLDDFQFGLADSTVTGTGVLGIGFVAEEVALTTYPNLPQALVDAGAISVNAYSLYLNEYDSDTGSILFGGVDTEKFIGELTVLPILQDARGRNYSSFTIGLAELAAVFSNGTDPANITLPSVLPAILDSGTTLSYLPDDVATPLFEAVNAYTYTEGSQGLTLIDCKYLDSDEELTMNFGFASSLTSSSSEVTISVRAAELVLDVYQGYQSQMPSEIPFDEVCLFGLQSSGVALPSGQAQSIEFALLGDTFLRSAYVVYHLENRQIGLAQANLGSSDSDVQELSASGTSLPVFTGVASQASNPTATTTRSSGGSGNGGGSSSTSQSGMVIITVTASPTASNNAAVASTRPPTGEAFAVMAVVGIFTLFGGLLFAL
ncbi:putative aspartic-type endopeptidase protein [Phaeoacremonium minimum UCRPA7]|uniref:Putative aspartic-type endopeptidase protein n=1 Tax=Phaeoacremonium minimum (strain UCR-PA7) TaxID=1286976 RepID=R8BHM0_PHAM7|nr:putative aspartic-type endopeptidase protein [Phaeoacremonium minimum UCRPA7]EON98784.1 putative aspartic-type endopeptidase protein [Phaeoacremonium minimum UCRPA7]